MVAAALEALVGANPTEDAVEAALATIPARELERALRWLAVDAIAPVVGAIVGATLNISEESLGELLAVYAGFFLFMGATDLLPHAHEHPSAKRVAVTAAGFLGVFLVSLVAQR